VLGSRGHGGGGKTEAGNRKARSDLVPSAEPTTFLCFVGISFLHPIQILPCDQHHCSGIRKAESAHSSRHLSAMEPPCVTSIAETARSPSPPSPPAAKRPKHVAKRPWPPDLWSKALLRGSGTVVRTLQRCLDLCNQDSSLQLWAFDLPPSTAGGAAAPKRYVAARAMDFSSACMALPQEQRHAYEIVRKSKPCWAFFDLERLECTGEANACAREIARVASGLLIERALELLGCAVSVQVLALGSSRPGKFSRHLIL
jgi:hypothetical protein